MKFSDELYLMLKNSYRKFKSNVYYNNGAIHLKRKIVDFENGNPSIEKRISSLAKAIIENDVNYFRSLLNTINFIVVPKMSTVDRNTVDNKNQIIESDKDDQLDKIKKVNFFFDSDIEIFILDTFWTLLLGRFYSQNESNNHCKAYIFDKQLYKMNANSLLESIDFNSLHLYRPFFKGYSEWKSQAVNKVREFYNTEQDSVLFSIDFTGFFYSIDLNVNEIVDNLLSINEAFRSDYNEFSSIQKFMNNVFRKYTKIISRYRKISHQIILPIGLISSGMFSNMHIQKFDLSIIKSNKTEYYSRYVDDILIVCKADSSSILKMNDEALLSYYPVDFSYDNGEISLTDFPSITTQKEKMKIFKFSSKSSRAYIDQLESQVATASDPNLMPDISLNPEDFLKYIMRKPNDSIKVRDAGYIDINQQALVKFINDFLQGIKNTDFKYCQKSRPNQRKPKENEAIEQIKLILTVPRLLQLYARWEKIFQFCIIVTGNTDLADEIYKKAEKSIKSLLLELNQEDYIVRRQSDIQKNIRSTMKQFLDFSLAQGLTVRRTLKNESRIKKQIFDLSIKIYKANLFEHRFLAFPMLNFFQETNIENLFSIQILKYMQLAKSIPLDMRRIEYSPKFIHQDEYSFYYYCKNYAELNQISSVKNLHNEYINIYKIIGGNLDYLDIEDSKITLDNDDYARINISVGSSDDDFRLHEIYIALANVNLGKHQMIRSKGEINFSQTSRKGKKDLYRLLNECYLEKQKPSLTLAGPNRYHKDLSIFEENHDQLEPVHFLLFPEVSVPLAWIPEIARFSRYSGISIICGIKYDVQEGKVINSVATVIPRRNLITYKSTSIYIREKNDYSPEERSLIESNKLKCEDSPKSLNYIFNWKGLVFSVFNCYELTDIRSRAYMSGNIDLIFTTQYNKDINYFSSIGDSISRELYCFLAQANSSEFGDTKIIGPLHGRDKIISTISGGEKDSIHIGKVNVESLRKAQDSNTNSYISSIKDNIRENERRLRKKFKQAYPLTKFASPSARYKSSK
ncbi:MAG: hypothetical protein PHC62_03020 [Candidatus Izemoplasmatales bacterium]|nr:hypothetical protein [Candidatus Izemoplasmatales bacterium]